MFKEKLLTLIVSVLFLCVQFFSALADECLDFDNAIDENISYPYPFEKRNDIGLFYDYKWELKTESVIIKRDINNFPIVRLSLFNKNILPGSAVKTLNGEDLSKIEDEYIIKLNQSTKKAELEIVGEANIVTAAGSIYNYMSYDLNTFKINSLSEINTKQGFFKLDYLNVVSIIRADVLKEGKLLGKIWCNLAENAGQFLYHPTDNILIDQVEIDKDKIQYTDTLHNANDVTIHDAEAAGVAKIRADFDFQRFPFDQQKLIIKFDTKENITTNPKAVLFYEDPIPQITLFNPQANIFIELENFRENNYLKEWEIIEINVFSSLNTDRAYKIDNIILNEPSDVLNIEIILERQINYYLYKIIIPVFLILLVAWAVLWIPTRQIESRLTTSIVSLLSLIAYNFVIQDEIPKINRLTSLDEYILLSYSYCVVPILMTIIFSSLLVREKQKLVTKANSYIRTWGVPVYFVIAFSIFVL
jgi:hypothetical protein